MRIARSGLNLKGNGWFSLIGWSTQDVEIPIGALLYSFLSGFNIGCMANYTRLIYQLILGDVKLKVHVHLNLRDSLLHTNITNIYKNTLIAIYIFHILILIQ